MEKQSEFLELLDFFQSKRFGTPGDYDYNAAFCQHVVAAASAEQASIWQLDTENQLHLIYSTDIHQDTVKDIILREGEGISGAAALSRQPVATADAASHPKHDQRIDERVGFPTRSMISAPIQFGDVVYGVVNILNLTAGRIFGDEWKERLYALGAIYGAALAVAGRLTPYTAAPGKTRREKEAQSRSRGDKTVIVGISQAVREALFLCLKAAKNDVPVLIRGETGTGKELAARRIHEISRKASGPFFDVSCAALTETLLESELFGHVKGAFSGATQNRQGKFVAASGGTLFLDEIGEMSKSSQAKILRTLQQKTVTPVGSDRPVRFDARIIAATNQDLTEKVKRGNFREDLYYRLCGIEILMPPLRERLEDIPLLAVHFLSKAIAEQDKSAVQRPLRVSQEALKMFKAFSWPGNVRQLEQALSAAVAICEGDEIQPGDLPGWLQKDMRPEWSEPPSQIAVSAQPGQEPGSHKNGNHTDEERARYIEALSSTKHPGTGLWNFSAAARKVGIPRKTFAYHLKKMGIVRRA